MPQKFCVSSGNISISHFEICETIDSHFQIQAILICDPQIGHLAVNVTAPLSTKERAETFLRWLKGVERLESYYLLREPR